MSDDAPREDIKIENVLPEAIRVMIPDCCREGWEDCPHVVQHPKPKKQNIGL